MSNVLTAEEKKKLDSRVRARYIFVAGMVATIGAIVASISLAPTLIFISTARAALNAPSVEEVSGARDDQTQALRAQALIEALKPIMAASTTPSIALATALELRPAGVSVTTVTYQEGQNSLVLSGTSARREAVNMYRDALEGSGVFSKVAVPIAALAGTQEGRFTITLTPRGAI